MIKRSPAYLIKTGLLILLLTLMMVLIFLSLQLKQSQWITQQKIAAITTLMNANRMHQHYADGMPARLNKDQLTQLMHSKTNADIAFKLSMGNQHKLIKMKSLEQNILNTGALADPYLLEWLSTIEFEALIDTFKIEANNEKTLAPIVVLTSPIWLVVLGCLLFAALMIGYGFGRMRATAPSYSVAAMAYKTNEMNQ